MTDLGVDKYTNQDVLYAEQKEWYTRLGGGTMADAILDRIIHNAIWLETGSTNMRKLFSGQ